MTLIFDMSFLRPGCQEVLIGPVPGMTLCHDHEVTVKGHMIKVKYQVIWVSIRLSHYQFTLN